MNSGNNIFHSPPELVGSAQPEGFPSHLLNPPPPLSISGTGHVSMGVISDGNSYGIPNGLIFGFPATCNDGSWKMVEV